MHAAFKNLRRHQTNNAIDMQTRAGSLPVLIAQAIFLLDRGQTDAQTDKLKGETDHITLGTATTVGINECHTQCLTPFLRPRASG